MEKQYRKCGVPTIDVLPGGSPYHEITIEILRNYHFTGTVEKIAETIGSLTFQSLTDLLKNAKKNGTNKIK